VAIETITFSTMKSARFLCFQVSLAIVLSLSVYCDAFGAAPFLARNPRFSISMAAKGFASESELPKKREKSPAQKDREEKSSKYDEISKAGGQEYRIFVRQFGSGDTSWLPSGTIAVPREAQVSDAIFANEEGLKQSIVRMFPKLRGQESEFEFGYNLKVYPDDPVEVAVKSGPKSSGPSIVNWINNVLSPVDTSGVQQQPPPSKD